jgi:hypothetical protein
MEKENRMGKRDMKRERKRDQIERDRQRKKEIGKWIKRKRNKRDIKGRTDRYRECERG